MSEKRTSVFSNGLIWFGAGVSLAEILTGTYFAYLTEVSKSLPFARFDAIAEDKVQPVPWVFGLSILFPWNHTGSFPFWKRRSLASFN